MARILCCLCRHCVCDFLFTFRCYYPSKLVDIFWVSRWMMTGRDPIKTYIQFQCMSKIFLGLFVCPSVCSEKVLGVIGQDNLNILMSWRGKAKRRRLEVIRITINNVELDWNKMKTTSLRDNGWWTKKHSWFYCLPTLVSCSSYASSSASSSLSGYRSCLVHSVIDLFGSLRYLNFYCMA